ncbi:neuralized-like protein 4 [Glandiceps talaboti]
MAKIINKVRRRLSSSASVKSADEDIEGVSEGSDITYTFYNKCGKNVKITNNGRTAEIKRTHKYYDIGIVMIEQRLRTNLHFEIRLESVIDKRPVLELGITTKSPNSYTSQPKMISSMQGLTLVWSGNNILGKNSEDQIYSLLHLAGEFYSMVGDTMGIMLSDDGILHFFYNGNELLETLNLKDCGIHNINEIYCFVNIYGPVEKVSICASHIDEMPSIDELVDDKPNETFYKDPKVVMEKMRVVIRALETIPQADVYRASTLVRLFLLEPVHVLKEPQVRQSYGDHLANLGAAQTLRKLLEQLMTIAQPTEDTWYHIEVVRAVCWSYSDYSLKIGRSFGQCGIISDMFNDLDKYGPATDNQEHKKLISSAISILYNCSRASDNRAIYHELRAVDRISPFLKSDDVQVATTAVLALSGIVGHAQERTHFPETDEKVVDFLISVLKGAIDEPTRRYKGFSALEVVSGLGNIARNDTDNSRIFDKDGSGLLVKLMLKGRPIEQECSLNTLTILAKLEANRKIMSETADVINALHSLLKVKGNEMMSTHATGTPLESDSMSVKHAAERALIAIRPPMALYRSQSFPKPTVPNEDCQYKKLCMRYKKFLNVPDGYFDTKYDRCFCNACHMSRGDNLYYSRGIPPKDYGIPIGWYKCAIGVPPRAHTMRVFEKWHVAFHGTRDDAVKSILECGDLLMPGKSFT